jgi:tetratricopeptide (TPR) repeat protein
MAVIQDGMNETTSLHDEIATLVHTELETLPPDPLSAAIVAAVRAGIMGAAERADETAPVKTVVQEYAVVTEKAHKVLSGILKQLEVLGLARSWREQHSRVGWEQTIEQLRGVAARGPEKGFAQWLQTYTQALVAWELETCERLVQEPLPSQPPGIQALLVSGTNAISTEDYPAALEMLNYLLEARSSDDLILDPLSRALVHLLIGRINLTRLQDSDAARKHFDAAKELAPQDGRACAALGDYYREQGDQRQALRMYQQGISLSPNQPGCFLGMSLLSEEQKSWDEANDWYQQVVRAQIRKALSPESDSLYLQIGKHLNEEDLEHLIRPLARTLSLRLSKPGPYPERRVQQLKGLMLEILERQSEAAQAYYEAGRRFAWSNENQAALDLLSRANTLDPSYVPVYWDLADAWRVRSYRDDMPLVDEAAIRRSLELWKSGYGLRAPDADYAWAYVTRALINEQLTHLSGSDRVELYWEAISNLERALLLSDQDVHHWAYLARFHRALKTESNALQAAGHAYQMSPGDSTVLEEWAAILANVGEFDEASRVIEKRLQSEPNDGWANGVKAYILQEQGQAQAALELITQVMPKDDKTIWNLDFQALCYRLVGRSGDAQKNYEKIMTIAAAAKNLEPDDQLLNGWAAYNLGQLEPAIQAFKALAADPILAAPALRNLGLCYLRLGQIEEGSRQMARGIELAINVREMDDTLNYDFKQLLSLTAPLPYREQVEQAIAEISPKVLARRQQLDRPRLTAEHALLAAIEELSDAGEMLERNNQTNTWAWLGSTAALAQLHLQAERWVDAAELYAVLQKEPERFPPARAGLEKAVQGLEAAAAQFTKDGNQTFAIEALQRATEIVTNLADPDKLAAVQQQLGDALLRGRQARAALEQFLHVLALPPLASDLRRQADAHCRCGCAYLDLSDSANARTSFAEALRLYRESGSDDAAGALAEVCKSLLRDVEHYWALEDAWKAYEDAGDTAAELRSDLAAGRTALLDYLSALYAPAPGDESAKHIPLTTPIAVYLGTGLIPDDTGSDWSLFKTYLPAMRSRIQSEMGVQVPGVRFRALTNESPHDTYTIWLDDALVDQGNVQLDSRFCPRAREVLEAMGVPGQDLVEPAYARMSPPGYWVRAGSWDKVTAQGVELWAEPWAYIVAHLELVLRSNLAEYLGTEEVKGLLDTWSNNAKDKTFSQAILSDQETQLRFGRVLRALLKESVPITRAEDILETFQSVATQELAEQVRAQRLALKSQLPGNAGGAQHVEMTRELEEKIALSVLRQDSKILFATPATEIEEILTALRALVGQPNNSKVLVTRRPELRSFIWRLAQVDSRPLPVLASEELLQVEPELATTAIKPNATESLQQGNKKPSNGVMPNA